MSKEAADAIEAVRQAHFERLAEKLEVEVPFNLNQALAVKIIVERWVKDANAARKEDEELPLMDRALEEALELLSDAIDRVGSE